MMFMAERNNTCKDVHHMKPKCRFKKKISPTDKRIGFEFILAPKVISY